MTAYKIASLALLASLLATILLSGCNQVGVKGADNIEIQPMPTIEPQAKFEDTGGIRPLTAEERLGETYSIDRSTYKIYLNKFYDTFGSLPNIPKDFGVITYLVYTGRKTDFNSLDKAYYIQPEFYPLFIKNGLKFYETYDPRYVGTYGWGVYPSEQWLQAQSGAKGYFQFFFKTGWGIETWQGMNLKAVSSCDWVTASIADPVFLTPPTYPIFCTEQNCGTDWARLKTIEFEISDSAKIGEECTVGLTTVAPPKEIADKWGDEHRTLYVAASASLVGVGTPFTGHIKVVE